ncbi:MULTISPECIES: multidrug effflux MFS transporter [Chromohalobacter]|uniref:Bcr/CflA family efflux transporter n=1 Tax=Chromohalobacter israelensis (strain ATCC BAA-138 / DSM 3043 / CIP 106854 / NCIMB 13768 / 1H11) TaxID=290398 RepID=Q1QUK2_CHRI1|nr:MULTISPECIES: multidrug effflux MFS transporter [Chromohalobacter]ABE59856.1 Drug resistance transporter Bcr/CflA subfamily [Chromohalobacter salexigens DSM 3043]MBZ5877256.1 multidrug effflux MFS transporter [Chromohalobacter salexigens]MDF9435727.1 multidrug effflux MFS transporter [Chromohalobacter israelensis]NQY46590.1 multidrug effflux MFS transporter [Chromohalobacter sp.]NWO57547.1 Bcr/CflA family drug resistance efflux transporter [Chromohalobacter salexigens]
MSSARLLPLLVGCVMLSPLAIDIYLPSLTVMAETFDAPFSRLQFTVTLLLLSVGLGQILVGPLTDRFGRRPVLLCGVVVYMLGALVGMTATSLGPLYVSRVLQGLGACATMTVAFAAVRDCFTAAQGAKLYSYLNGALCIIPALAPVVGGSLAVTFGWRSNFAFMFAFAAILGIGAVWRFAETRPSNTVVERRLYHWARYRPVLASARFVYFAGLAGVIMSAILVYVSSAPVVLVDRLGLSELAFSGWFGANALVNIVAFFFAPRIIHRLGRVGTVRLGLCLIIASGILQALSVMYLPLTALGFMVPVGVLSVGFSLALGAASSLALEPFRERAGTAAALLGALQLGGGALLATCLLATALPPQWALALIAVLIVSPLLWLSYRVAPEA